MFFSVDRLEDLISRCRGIASAGEFGLHPFGGGWVGEHAELLRRCDCQIVLRRRRRATERRLALEQVIELTLECIRHAGLRIPNWQRMAWPEKRRAAIVWAGGQHGDVMHGLVEVRPSLHDRFRGVTQKLSRDLRRRGCWREIRIPPREIPNALGHRIEHADEPPALQHSRRPKRPHALPLLGRSTDRRDVRQMQQLDAMRRFGLDE
jgi:hypothetical protein